MKILLTGASGYIGKRLLAELVSRGDEVTCFTRNPGALQGIPWLNDRVKILEVDLLNPVSDEYSQLEFDAAYYLVHSMTSSIEDFEKSEALTAVNFVDYIGKTSVRQIIYLGGIANSSELSPHLASRRNVEGILKMSGRDTTILRAGIIIGSGSASFEIIRDLVEKLPVMITPKWLNTKCQPIAIKDVIGFLTGVLLRSETYNRTYDIGGPDILTYREMLMQFAKVRGYKRYIITLPVLTPRLSSYWLYFVTSTSYKLAVNLVNSMKVEVTCRPNDLARLLGIKPLRYNEALVSAFQKIEKDLVLSSWKDPISSSSANRNILKFIEIPTHGCLMDIREKKIRGNTNEVVRRIWSIGGTKGWYYANWLWNIRGMLDKLTGGVGLRRGRRNEEVLYPGDTVDFWRVLISDRGSSRLLLYAEMRLPGEAWLEFRIVKRDEDNYLRQTATFRPRGLSGRLYWYMVLPFHAFIFNGMITRLAGESR
ncbi:MAG: SDR family oxidoreductase [Ignavibacteriales bacterium]